MINLKQIIKEEINNFVINESYQTDEGEYGYPYCITYKKFIDEDGEEMYHVKYETENYNDTEDMPLDDIAYYFGDDTAEMVEDEEGEQNEDGSFTINNLSCNNPNDVREVNNLALRLFGETYSFGLAGYLLVDGKLLDFSQGQGYRTADHRQIGLIDNMDMYSFMNLGNIRLIPESPGITLSRKPTYQQMNKLSEFISKYGRKENYFYVDVVDSNGNNIWNKAYDYPYPEFILRDIENYFDDGTVPSDDNDGNNGDSGYALY